MIMSTQDPVRRWVAVVFAIVLIGYSTLFWTAWRSRMSRYRAELARNGLHPRAANAVIFSHRSQVPPWGAM
jgi:hypothetical protein